LNPETSQDATLLMMAAAGGDQEAAGRLLSSTKGHDAQFAQWKAKLDAMTAAEAAATLATLAAPAPEKK